jgi:FMN phosphatase YigB (HAD superfamily)
MVAAQLGCDSIQRAKDRQDRLMIHIASFDVFDTVLTRAVGSPSAVFLLLGRSLSQMQLITCTPEAFARARVAAERRAFRNAGGIDSKVTLREIYTELGAALRLTKAQCQPLIERELALETKVIRPVPGAIAQVQTARARGQRVVFMSDMYLPAEFIQKQLARYGLWEDGDAWYVSCAHEKSKASGALFHELLRREAVSPRMISHAGNDLQADVLAATRLGLHVTPFFRGNLNRYEQILESHAWATEGLASVMAGASRVARLTMAASTPKHQALRDVAASVIAPTLVGYVLWILQRAQQLGIQRLYFVSRDGQILLEIAHRLASKLRLSCELRYLYGSRRAWLFPALTSINEEQLAWISDSIGSPSVRHVLCRVDIAPEEMRASLDAIGLPENSWSRKLRHSECQSLCTLLLQDTRVRELMLQRAAKRRHILMQYMRQEGLLDSCRWGLVDVGWFGKLQDALRRLLATEGKGPTRGFYFGLRNTPLPHGPDQREAYFFDARFRVGFTQILPGNCLTFLLEAFCAADHGTVVGFKEEDGKVHPIIQEERNTPLLDWGLLLMRRTVNAFVENLFLDASLINIEADVRPAIGEVLKAFWLQPAFLEAMAFADFPLEFGLDVYQTVSFSRSYRWKHVAKAFYSGSVRHATPTLWHKGSLTLTPPQIRFALRVIMGGRRRLRTAVQRALRVLRKGYSRDGRPHRAAAKRRTIVTIR